MQGISPERYQRLQRLVAEYGQSHLLAHWPNLTDPQRRCLADQIEALDLALLQRLFSGTTKAEEWSALVERWVPPPAVTLSEGRPGVSSDAARESGERALAAGRVGMILVAGGQGTRLGFNRPKGMFPLGPVSHRSLFQILIDRLRAMAKRFHTAIPLYLMTSPATHEETIEYLDQQARLGLSAEDLHVFCQGTMPALAAETGRVLLAAPGEIFLSPDGHGGMLAALARSGGLDHARQRGIEHLFYCQVDNPLATICDPLLIGHHLLANSELTSQVVRKRDPLEKVGNVVSVDGRLHIVEYSDLPDEVAYQQSPDGQLRFWAGSIAVHVFRRDFLERTARRADALPFHLARKMVPHVDERGEPVQPDRPNAIKFERFIFDLLPWADHALVVEAAREDVFAPVKNAEGSLADTPATARAAMIRQHRQWLVSAGARIAEGVPVEIDPLWALDAEQVRQRQVAGRCISEPTYFSDRL